MATIQLLLQKMAKLEVIDN